MRKAISICCYVAAGFFVYLVSLLAFLNMGALPATGGAPIWAKFAMMGVFCVFAAIALVIGLAVTRFKQWKRDFGIVLVSGAGVTAFVVFTIACLLWSPESRALFPPETRQLFSDLPAGISSIILFIGTGAALITVSRRGPERG